MARGAGSWQMQGRMRGKAKAPGVALGTWKEFWMLLSNERRREFEAGTDLI